MIPGSILVRQGLELNLPLFVITTISREGVEAVASLLRFWLPGRSTTGFMPPHSGSKQPFGPFRLLDDSWLKPACHLRLSLWFSQPTP